MIKLSPRNKASSSNLAIYGQTYFECKVWELEKMFPPPRFAVLRRPAYKKLKLVKEKRKAKKSFTSSLQLDGTSWL